MKPYIHNPSIYRQHYQIGSALPGFQGSRMQHGNGIGAFLGKLARHAIPLLSKGVKFVAPHLKHAFKGIAKDVTSQVASKLLQPRSMAPMPRKKSKRKRKVVSKRKKVKASTSKDIF